MAAQLAESTNRKSPIKFVKNSMIWRVFLIIPHLLAMNETNAAWGQEGCFDLVKLLSWPPFWWPVAMEPPLPTTGGLNLAFWHVLRNLPRPPRSQIILPTFVEQQQQALHMYETVLKVCDFFSFLCSIYWHVPTLCSKDGFFCNTDYVCLDNRQNICLLSRQLVKCLENRQIMTMFASDWMIRYLYKKGLKSMVFEIIFSLLRFLRGRFVKKPKKTLILGFHKLHFFRF